MFKGANDFFHPRCVVNVLSMCYNHCLDQDLFLTIQDSAIRNGWLKGNKQFQVGGVEQ